MTTEIQTVAMTDPQLTSNNNNNNNNNNNTTSNNNNNNNDGEPKYLHKKFKKMATTEASTPMETNSRETSGTLNEKSTNAVATGTPPPPPSEISSRKRDHVTTTTTTTTTTTSIGSESSRTDVTPESEAAAAEARKTGYVCPYCKLSCAKPSVLQKHIRAHTNERPYPCVPCGFAFKTKSNLYKHCRSRAHALKMEGGDAGKVSEDSDISLSDSASNGTGTPPPAPASIQPAPSSVKTVKTGKIYKPKFHTGLQCANNNNNEADGSSTTSLVSPASGTLATASIAKPNAEQLQEHIDKIITDNQAIVDAIDPRLHKLVHRQQSLIETRNSSSEQPLNLSSFEQQDCHDQLVEASSSLSSLSVRKRCYSDSFAQESRHEHAKNPEGSIIKDLLLKSRVSAIQADETCDNYVCPNCKTAYTSLDNLEAHRRSYCKSVNASPLRNDFQLDLDKRDEYETSIGARSCDYYGAIQPLPSPGPLLGNTRLVDAYAPPSAKKQRSESVPTSLRSLEELSKYPRPNSLQMFGGEVRILDNSGEMKTMRIEPRQSGSPPSEHIVVPTCNSSSSSSSNKSVTSETSSIVVRSGLHSGGTMVHKPSPSGGGRVTPVNNSSSSSSAISLANASKILAPIIPNISTPSLAPTMSRYNYLEPLNPLTSITAYNPLTLPQAGIASILHGGKVIPYVPGMPGPHTLNGGSLDISTSTSSSSSSLSSSSSSSSKSATPSSTATSLETKTYKIIPGLPGLHIVTQQPLDLASPSRVQTPGIVPGIPGPTSNAAAHPQLLGQPLDLASPAKENKTSFRNVPGSPLASPKHPPARLLIDTSNDKYRATVRSSSIEHDRQTPRSNVVLSSKLKRDQDVVRKEFSHDKHGNAYPNGRENENATNSHSKRYSPKTHCDGRKRPASWSIAELESPRSYADTSRSPTGFVEHNERTRNDHDDSKSSLLVENYPDGAKLRIPKSGSRSIAATSNDNYRTDLPSGSSTESAPVRLETKRIVSDDETPDEETTTKFLRPTSLPLKPGTFTPKRHHGITPTANTLPLISPETPRPKKSYGQLYLNGHAYTYLGLKCSTRVFYCTVNRPQPMYVTQQHGLSMYSNWKICKETPPDLDMAHYDSRHRPPDYTVAWKKQDDILTHSSQRPNTPTSPDSGLESDTQEKTRRVKIFDGGFESNEDYTYVRGRGRGRYVCEECGIRCKKPSMLKKHIRTHTDVRPYTCKHCTFSFKTKGNLTKHMKSKAHYKKCVELGVVPVPTSVCDENIDKEAIARLVAGGGNAEDTSDDEEDESEIDESDESGSEEQEAAQSLLSLSQRSSNRLPGLLPTGRPSTYPYALTLPAATCVTQSLVSTTCATSMSIVFASSSTTGTMIPSELSNRYYFPSTRDTSTIITEERRDSVIRSSRRSEEDSDVEIEETMETTRNHQTVQQPMDLTTRQTSSSSSSSSSSSTSSSLSSPGAHRPRQTDILTPVSEPVLMQTIVQTMERLPLQSICSSSGSREWKPEAADGHMLQAYLTERHVMDSKIKQQYRVGTVTPITTLTAATTNSPNNKTDKHGDRDIYTRQMEFMNSRNTESSSTPTVTYTNPSRLHQSYLEMRIKSKQHQTNEDAKPEMRDNDNIVQQERRNYETKILHTDNDNCRSSYPLVERENVEAMRLLNPATTRTNTSIAKNCPDRMSFNLESGRDVSSDRQPSGIYAEANTRIYAQGARNEPHESRSLFNAVKTMSEIERNRDTCNQQDYRVVNNQEARIASSPRLHENVTNGNSRPPSRETRTPCQEYRGTNQTGQISFHEARTSSQEFKLPSQEVRPPSCEFKSPCQAEARSSSSGQELVTAATPSNNNVSVVVVLDHQRHPSLNDVRSPSVRENMRVVNEQRGPEHSRQSFETAAAAAAAATMSIHHDANNKIHEIHARLAKSPVETRTENVASTDAKRHEIERTKQSINESVKHTVARKMVVGGPGFRSPSPPGVIKPQAEFLQPSSGPAPNYVSVTEDGRSVCGICNKVFSKPSQLRLHINIHYFERPFRCESCAVSFRTKGHLTKHERSVSHHNKVSMTSTFGAATTSNPRPFKCTDCKIAFRIHGHLAKHLRSKMHIMKLECLGKLPFGTYAEMERSGVNLNDIDTTDCDNSLTSLQILAQKLYEKDPSKMGQWDAEMMIPHQGASGGETSSDEGEPIPPPLHHQYHPGVPAPQQQQQQQQMNHESEQSRVYHHTAQQPALLLADEASKVAITGCDVARHVVATNAPRFVPQQRVEYATNRSNVPSSLCCDNHENPRVPHDLDHQHQLPYKCQICAISVRTVNELQVHRFVEHNNLEPTGNAIITVASQLNDHPREMAQKLLIMQQQRSNDETGSLARDDPVQRKIDES